MKLQQTKVELAPPPAILELLSNFLLKFSPQQYEYSPTPIYNVASAYTDYILSGQAEAISGIGPLLSALKKIQQWDIS